MKYFYNPNNLKSKILSEGVVLKPMWGDKIMMNIVELEPGSEVPLHSHPNEQAGIVLEGEFEFTIGEEKKTVKKRLNLNSKNDFYNRYSSPFMSKS